MKTRLAPLISAIALVLLSCTPEEPFIDSFDDTWRLLSVDRQGAVSVVDVPDQQAGNSVWSDPTDSAAHVLRRFRDQVFLLHSKRPWIVVFDADTLRALDTITLSSDPGVSIAFANATTAYVTVPTKNLIDVVDLTVNRVARTITMPSRPMSIDANGNQLCVTLPDSNAVAIIDSRTVKVESVITTSAVPWFVASDPTSAQFCIVSMGQGKVNPGTQTAATMQFLNATTRALTTPLELTPRGTTAIKTIPTGLVISATQQAFVSSNVALMRVSTRTRNRVTTMQPEGMAALSYNEARAELVAQLTSTSAVAVYTANGDARTQLIPLAAPSTSAIGIAP
jgi:YVTN family beta-propeller protein